MKHKGEILKGIIKTSAYNITQVAEGIGINRSQFSTMLNSTNIKDEVIERACEFLGVDWHNYFSEELATDFEKRYYELLEKRNQDLEKIASLQDEILKLQQANNELSKKLAE